MLHFHASPYRLVDMLHFHASLYRLVDMLHFHASLNRKPLHIFKFHFFVRHGGTCFKFCLFCFKHVFPLRHYIYRTKLNHIRNHVTWRTEHRTNKARMRIYNTGNGLPLDLKKNSPSTCRRGIFTSVHLPLNGLSIRVSLTATGRVWRSTITCHYCFCDIA